MGRVRQSLVSQGRFHFRKSLLAGDGGEQERVGLGKEVRLLTVKVPGLEITGLCAEDGGTLVGTRMWSRLLSIRQWTIDQPASHLLITERATARCLLPARDG